MSLLHRVNGAPRVNSAAMMAVLMQVPEARRSGFITRLARRVRAIGGVI